MYVIEEKWQKLDIWAVRDTRVNPEDQAVFYGEDSKARAGEYRNLMNAQLEDGTDRKPEEPKSIEPADPEGDADGDLVEEETQVDPATGIPPVAPALPSVTEIAAVLPV